MNIPDMVDCTHANLPEVIRSGALMPDDLIAWYGTGSPDIRWTDADRAQVEGHMMVMIDQGGDGSPLPAAIVRDVEARAWTVAAAVDRGNWHAARPTIYISYGRLGELVTAGWDGDVWVADWVHGVAPDAPPPLPAGAKFRIIAWQFRTFDTHDVSKVFDHTWPFSQAWQETAMQSLPTIKQGATGTAVETAQGLILARAAETGIFAIDGIFGPKTDAAIRHLQANAKITVDGIVGPQTWPVLMGVT